MWRKLFLVILLLMVSVSTVSAQGKSYHAQRFDVDVRVQEDGSFAVTETVVFQFVGGDFSFVFRELETDFTDGIVDISAAVDGEEWPFGNQPGQVEIDEDGDEIRVEWHLPPTSDATHTFTLAYTMLGVVRQTESADLIRYQPLPDEFEYDIDVSRLTLTLPPTAVSLETPTVDEGAVISLIDNQIFANQVNVDDSDEMTIEARFAPGTLIDEMPQWQQRRAEQNRFGPLWIGVAGAIFLAGFLGIVVLERRYQVDVSKTAVPQYEPPSDLAPALAGVINGNGAEPTWVNGLATLFDLADRGILQISESPEKKWYQKHEFDIEVLKRPSDLRPHEQGLLDALFDGKDGPVDSIKLSKLSQSMSGKQWKKYTEPLKAELKLSGFISEEVQQTRKMLFAIGIVMTVLAAVSIILTVIVFEPIVGLWPMLIVGALFLVGLGLIILASTIKPLTYEGRAAAADWQRFYNHMHALTKNKASSSKMNAFQQFLPYAASYGLLQSWVKWYEKQGGTELPHYFNVISASPADGFAAFTAMTNASGSAGGSAGGGGAAGGGGSGAG